MKRHGGSLDAYHSVKDANKARPHAAGWHSGKGGTMETGKEEGFPGAGVAVERRSTEVLGAVKLLCVTLESGSMSLYICPNPENVRHRECKLWTWVD